MNRAERRAYARRVIVRRHPVTGEKASGREVQVARALYARTLRGQVLAEAVEEMVKPKSWIDRFRKRVLGR